MQELPFYIGECVGQCMCVCVWREFLIQGFVSHRLEAFMINVVLKMCSSALGYNLLSLYLNKTLPDLNPMVGYFGFLTWSDIFTSISFAI